MRFPEISQRTAVIIGVIAALVGVLFLVVSIIGMVHGETTPHPVVVPPVGVR